MVAQIGHLTLSAHQVWLISLVVETLIAGKPWRFNKICMYGVERIAEGPKTSSNDWDHDVVW